MPVLLMAKIMPSVEAHMNRLGQRVYSNTQIKFELLQVQLNTFRLRSYLDVLDVSLVEKWASVCAFSTGFRMNRY
jgi:hypothetical protein